MRHFGFTSVFFCFFVSASFAVCVDDDEKYIKGFDAPGRRIRAKSDDHISDVELISTKLKSKLDHGLDETELLEKKFDFEKSLSHADGRYEDTVVSSKHEHDHMPLGKEFLSKIEHGLNFKELSDDELKAVISYLKELGAGKEDIEEFFFKKLDQYDEKIDLDKNVEFSKFHGTEKMIGKGKDFYKDEDHSYRTEDSDAKTYFAETLAHMKMAGDAETYPYLKADVNGRLKKEGEEKKITDPHLKAFGEEEYFEKAEEISKSHPHLIMEHETDSYIKKFKDSEKDAAILHGEKFEKETYPGLKLHNKETLDIMKSLDAKKALNFDKEEEKLLEEWKAKHKDLFALGESIGFDEEKTKGFVKAMENSEIFKSKKTMDGAFKDEELHHDEGTRAYEKARGKAHEDAKILINDDTLKMRKLDGGALFGGDKKIYEEGLLTGKFPKDEKLHEFDEKLSTGVGKGLHEVGLKGYAYKAHFDEATKEVKEHGKEGKIAFESGKSFYDEKVLNEDILKAMKELYGSKLNFDGEIKKDGIFDEKLAFEAGKALYDEKLHLSEEEKEKDALGFKHLLTGNEKVIHDKIASEAAKSLHEEKAHHAEDHLSGTGAGFKKEKGIYEDEMHKKMHGIGSSLHHEDEKVGHDFAFAEGTYKDEKIHGFGASEEKAVHKHLGGAHIEHGIKSEGSHIVHGLDTDKHHHFAEVEKVGEKAEGEKAKGKIHEVGNKFLEFLKGVFKSFKCHLVTMRPRELLSIIDCISKSKNPLLCEKFAACEKKMPPQVISALEKCQKDIAPGEKKCTRYAPLYSSVDIPIKIFQCIVRNTKELVPEEKGKMIDFEECARKVKAEGCPRAIWTRSQL